MAPGLLAQRREETEKTKVLEVGLEWPGHLPSRNPPVQTLILGCEIQYAVARTPLLPEVPAPYSLAAWLLPPHTQHAPFLGFTPVLPLPGKFSAQTPMWLAPFWPLRSRPRQHPLDKSSPALLSKASAPPVSCSFTFP